MNLFKAYVARKPIEHKKLLNQLELKLIGINNDVDGAYMLLISLNGAKPKDLENFRGIKKVYVFNQNYKENYFKLLIAPNKKISYDKMVAGFDLNLAEIGTSDEKNFWKKKYPFMIFKSNKYVHPDQLKKYRNVKKVALLEDYELTQ